MPEVNGIDKKIFQDINSHQNKTRVPKKVLDRDDFMLLFVKQLEYQDPLHPLENNEMATQLALFNQLDELFSLNKKFEELISIQKNNRINNLSSLIGKIATIEGNTIWAEDGKFLKAKLQVEKPIQNVEITISDKNGNIIKKIDMGALGPGEYDIPLDIKDQKIEDGVYYISVKTESKIKPKILVEGKITGIILGDKIKLKFNNEEEINPEDIIELSEFNSIKKKEYKR